MELNEGRLEKVENIDIKKSINGFKPRSGHESGESLAGYYQKSSAFDGLSPLPVSVGVKKSAGTAIRDLQERNFVMDDRKISRLFTGYFNNKMTLLLFLVQVKNVKPDPALVQTVHSFLDDLFRHMFEGTLQRRYRRLFQWLKLFFVKLPEVSVYQRDKARDFIRAIYDAFGMHLKNDV